MQVHYVSIANIKFTQEVDFLYILNNMFLIIEHWKNDLFLMNLFLFITKFKMYFSCLLCLNIYYITYDNS